MSSKKESDKIAYNLTDEEWEEFDSKRLKDKQINNKIGELHEYLLSNCNKYCKSNDIDKTLKVDVMKKDKTEFYEIKNNNLTLPNWLLFFIHKMTYIACPNIII
jgi:hypothetical protein